MSTDSAHPRTGSPLATLRRISASRPTVRPGERCEMCAEPIADAHQHVVDVENRSLMCTCRPCYLLFTDHGAELRYRSVPDRYLSFPDFRLDRADWDELQIPVGLVFVFRNSVQHRLVAVYPSPAGATESELPLESWEHILTTNPSLSRMLPDVEALLLRMDEGAPGGFRCHLVPIDACYELVGTMRQTWRGFDGGQEAQAAMAAFFDTVDAHSRPAPAMPTPTASENADE